MSQTVTDTPKYMNTVRADAGKYPEDDQCPLSWRAALGVVTPSTNRVIEPDFGLFCGPGVTLHVARSKLDVSKLIETDDEDAAFTNLVEAIDAGTPEAMESLMTCRPDYCPMGMSIETFWGGGEGAQNYLEKLQKLAGDVPITIGSFAILEALKLYNVKRIAFVCPYFPIGARNIVQFFDDHGISTARWQALKAQSVHKMAGISEARLADVLKELDSPDVDAIVQAGGNMSMVRLADAAERFLGKPVIAINTAIMWNALRNLGIEDRFEGLGRLVREF